MKFLLQKLATGLVYLFLLTNALLVLGPVIWTVLASFKPGSNMFSSSFSGWSFSLEHYVALFQDTPYLQWYLNTFALATANMLISLVVVTMTAYVFSRYRFKGKRNVLMGVLVLQMFPAFLSMTAIYILLSKLNMIDTYAGLLFVYVAGSLPFMTWLVKGYFDAIPTSLDEAAKIDGAGHMTIFIEIILPLARPILVFVALVSFTGPWMDFILPTLILRSEEKMTLAIGIFSWITSNSAENFTLFAAGSLLVAIPITLLFVATQKHITTGLVSGAVKE
ncbi:sugar ABC transporter permease [Vibrio brasiliensis]|jgi:arabinogalactan oligomer/maltooligosaccharide transport system permease protein|uniref:Maltodextrin transport system permease MalD n=1 Tax=Vibrio brasiliensis LMG 20546 TaxID=945543 RepID=E8LVW1_9VIBR|nr:sugar ABC transporter permease [Vibrio brasiliensis]KGY14303.1 maltose ABC transporter permease [Vibrio tubiashii]EGA65217.1 maltodextrin transport system permease MalD [Vibrio brasiliensis LMG 20546]MCG9647537.1 sugar ABC transporter permease [Vibrio brasiliensis]MCG9726336.1 sugar ABC transporter permease [Vibrio brasiliensis]MCG9752399.1 sugar ABC transporter permease [Vibrio brasiliensis]